MIVNLWDSQRAHYDRISDICKREKVYLDTSVTGRGKTITALKLAQDLGLDLIVVGPTIALSMWNREAAKYNVKILKSITYDLLRGSKTNPPKNGLVKLQAGRYIADDQYKNHLQKGILLVFDEVQKVKNRTAQLKAAHCLVKTLVEDQANRSKAALLGAIPCDKIDHTESLLKMLGIINHDELYHYHADSHEYEPVGLRDLMVKAKSYDRPLADEILNSLPLDKKSIPIICNELYVNIIKDRVVSSITDAEYTKDKTVHIYNDIADGYYQLLPEDDEILEKSLSLISRSMLSRGSLADVTNGLILDEYAKLNTAIRLASNTLDANPKAKVILGFNYKDSFRLVSEVLSGYKPAIINGTTKIKDRDEIISKFQEPNTESRLLLISPRVGGVSISLDDRYGDYPRYMYVIPSYNFIDIYQSIGRIFRGDMTKSNSTFRFIYSRKYPQETKILKMLLKAEVSKNIIHEGATVLLPGEYPAFYEDGINGQTYPLQIDRVNIVVKRKKVEASSGYIPEGSLFSQFDPESEIVDI